MNEKQDSFVLEENQNWEGKSFYGFCGPQFISGIAQNKDMPKKGVELWLPGYDLGIRGMSLQLYIRGARCTVSFSLQLIYSRCTSWEGVYFAYTLEGHSLQNQVPLLVRRLVETGRGREGVEEPPQGEPRGRGRSETTCGLDDQPSHMNCVLRAVSSDLKVFHQTQFSDTIVRSTLHSNCISL